MANLTITVDEETLKRARIRAIERGESVNQYLARRLEEYARGEDAGLPRRRKALDFVELSRELHASSQGAGWTREELYEERTR